MGDNLIAFFAFEEDPKGVVISREKHYRLVPSEEVTPEDLERYRERPLTEN
jgi:hypothetical protein